MVRVRVRVESRVRARVRVRMRVTVMVRVGVRVRVRVRVWVRHLHKSPPPTFSFHAPSNSLGRKSVMKARVCVPRGSKQMFSPPVPRAACSHSHLSE